MLLSCVGSLKAQDRFAVKTNLLYGGVARTPNLGVEIGLAPRWTLEVSGGYNPFNLQGSDSDNKKLVHWAAMPEFRYWTCQRFNGHFVGVHGLYGNYNSGVTICRFFSETVRMPTATRVMSRAGA